MSATPPSLHPYFFFFLTHTTWNTRLIRCSKGHGEKMVTNYSGRRKAGLYPLQSGLPALSCPEYAIHPDYRTCLQSQNLREHCLHHLSYIYWLHTDLLVLSSAALPFLYLGYSGDITNVTFYKYTVFFI